MDKERENELRDEIEKIWVGIRRQYLTGDEETIPADEARDERIALAKRIGRLHLAYSRVLIDRLGETEGRSAILEAIRSYSARCAEVRKKGQVDYPDRAAHQRFEYVEEGGVPKLKAFGCGIAREFLDQDEGKLGALYCYVDPCAQMLTRPNLLQYHTELEPLGDEFCGFGYRVADDEEMKLVLEKGRDYARLDPVVEGGDLPEKED